MSAPVQSLAAGGRLTWQEARESPCLTCHGSYCCDHVLVSEFEIGSLMDVDHALYLLNFEGIVIGVGQDLVASIYLNQPCTYFDRDSRLCTVHSTPLQPAVCRTYPAHACVYRRRMVDGQHPEKPLVDAARMRWLADQLLFDERRRVVGGPQWDEVIAAFATMPLQRRPAPLPGPDPVRDEWRSIVLTRKDGSSALTPHSYGEAVVSDPCTGCAAWCCHTLVFSRPVPADASAVDFIRYCLGFPSVEIGISEGGWAVIVHTTCRHLEGDRCSIYGRDERPLKCSYYDALSCSYRYHFGTPEPADIVRVSRDQFPLVERALVFDHLGRVSAVPPLSFFRELLEEAERAQAR